MNAKSLILIVAALLFAGGTAFVASRLMGQKPVQQVQVQEQPGKKVLVAKGNLPAGTFIKEEDVSWQKWPTDGVFGRRPDGPRTGFGQRLPGRDDDGSQQCPSERSDSAFARL